jgi:hypothetical protein
MPDFTALMSRPHFGLNLKPLDQVESESVTSDINIQIQTLVP